MNILDLSKQSWWDYVEEDIRELLKESVLLINIFEKRDEDGFHDYSFVVFPAAKGYEGFLKKIFLELGFINEKQYFGKRFRIGKALNPSLDTKRYGGKSVYNKLVSYCNEKELPDFLWKTWRTARNIVFHWFPNEKNAISLPEAKKRVLMVTEAMDRAFVGCKINRRHEQNNQK